MFSCVYMTGSVLLFGQYVLPLVQQGPCPLDATEIPEPMSYRRQLIPVILEAAQLQSRAKHRKATEAPRLDLRVIIYFLLFAGRMNPDGSDT